MGQTIKTLSARIRQLEGALQPFARYYEARTKKPMIGLDDIIHQIHTGSEYEAAITMTQCREACRLLKWRSK
jgi:hypothetical protein